MNFNSLQLRIFIVFCFVAFVFVLVSTSGRLGSSMELERQTREYSEIDKFLKEARIDYNEAASIDCESVVRTAFRKNPTPKSHGWETALVHPKLLFCNVCDHHFGYEYLKEWMAAKHDFCKGKDTSLTCYNKNHAYSPTKTWPHTFCQGENILIDSSRMVKTLKLKHRPTYWKGNDPVYWIAKPGAVKGACQRTSSFNLELLSRDMTRDFFDGFIGDGDIDLNDLKERSTRVGLGLFVMREGEEYKNLFHAMTDIFSAFVTTKMLGYNRMNTTLVLFDGNPIGPFDVEGWKNFFSPKSEIIRGNDVAKKSERLLFDKVAFVAPGYSSFIYSFLSSDNICKGPSRLFIDFSNTFLLANSIRHDTDWVDNQAFNKLKITIVARRPSSHYRRIDRQFSDEKKLLKEMKEFVKTMIVDGEEVEATIASYDFATLTFKEQITLIAESDVLVGVHGAALTHLLFLPLWGGLVEVFPHTGQKWRCFENMAIWSGKGYTRYQAPANSHTRTSTGDAVAIDMRKFSSPLKRMIETVIHHKKSYVDIIRCRTNDQMRQKQENR